MVARRSILEPLRRLAGAALTMQLYFCVTTGISILVAALSWWAIESRALALKRFFSYGSDAAR